MAGSVTCFVCKSKLETFENVVSLWSAQSVNPPSNANGFVSEPWLCHHKCFTCSVCGSTLHDGENLQTYNVSNDKKLFCSRHYYCQNSDDERLIHALNNFKERSLALKATWEKDDEGPESGLESNEGISRFNCSCTQPKFVERVAGYEVECPKKDCPNRDSFIKNYKHRFKSFCDLGSSRLIGHASSVSPEGFYRDYFYGVKHWNYCVKEEHIGAILFTLKPESNPQSKGSFRYLKF